VNRQGQRKQVFITVAIIPGTAQSVASLQDLTERMQAQEARERLEAQLRQAQKMEAVGILAGGVAHDFNNLLTVILGNSELALAQVQADQPLHKEMSTIQRAARRGATLTRQLLAFSRRQVLQQQPLDVNQRVQALSDMLSRLIGVDISLQLDLAPHLAPVSADAVALDQVLMNLVLNARDAMPQGGTLRVATAQFTADGAYLLSHPAAHAGEYVHITVADTGMGMTREAQQHLFEPFFTTKEVGKGTGLGLSVVYGIVQQHHGWIDVTSQVGQGTQFDIYLPAADGAGESEERNVKRET
jgi:signal transduction histidine kinase